jgi:hypothetical protein
MLLLLALALALAGLLAHAALCRIRPSKEPTREILACFAGALALGLVAGSVAPGIRATLRDGPFAILTLTSFQLLACLCYRILYAGIEASSPTLAIVRRLQRGGAGGCSADDLEHVISDVDFLLPRLDALCADGLILEAEGRMSLTKRGQHLARGMETVARVWNLGRGA